MANSEELNQRSEDSIISAANGWPKEAVVAAKDSVKSIVLTLAEGNELMELLTASIPYKYGSTLIQVQRFLQARVKEV